MKKLWKHEWKYYLFFFAALLFAVFLQNRNSGFSTPGQVIDHSVVEEMMWETALYVNGSLLMSVMQTLLVGILVIKSIFYWLEKDSYGRDFLSTLPVTKVSRKQFHFLMDSLLVIGVVSIFSIYLYITINGQLAKMGFYVPWIGSSILGEAITCITYLLLLLAIINVLECIFVDGFARILGTAGSIFMCKIILVALFKMEYSAKWIQNIYGFFMMESPGGCYYQKGVISSIFSMNVISADWIHNLMDYSVYYKGELIGISADELANHFDRTMMCKVGQLVDFSNVSSYIGYVLGYLVLAILLMVLAFYLSQKQEMSRQGFYFDFGRYLFCGLLCVSFAAVMMQNTVAIWHKYLVMIAAGVIFIILNYLMKPERKQFKKRKTVEA